MSGQRHILFVSSWYPTKTNPTHGIFNRYFAEAVALTHKVSVLHVVSVNEQAADVEMEEAQEAGINTLRVYYRKVNSRLPGLSQLQKMRRLTSAFDTGFEKLVALWGKPDLIHLNVVMPAGIGVLHLAHKHALPYVVNENWSGYCEEDGNYKGFFQKHYTQRVIAGAKAILPTSTFLEQAMRSHGLNGPYEVVPNVVDVKRFRPMPRGNDGLLKLIHISSLTDREKNVSGMIRAFAKARRQVPSLRLDIVGDGPERAALSELAAKADATGSIVFRGRLVGETLVEAINAADALMMFSHFETFCLVIIEAFACGKPVITSNAGAIKSYMKPELGLMVEKKNEEQLAQAIVAFAATRQNYNPGFIRDYALENYSYEKVGAKLGRVYEESLLTTDRMPALQP
jgi:glycosyltransferase involved in cell wall biosynthesis